MKKADIKISVSEEEKQAWKDAASAAGRPLQQFIRRHMNTLLNRQDLTAKYDRIRAASRVARGKKARAARTAKAKANA